MAKKKVHISHEEENGEAWLLPYSDLMTLLLAVFIVLFAVSQIDAQKAQMMSDQFSQSMMNKEYIEYREQLLIQNMTESEKEEFDEMSSLKQKIDVKIMEEEMLDFVDTYIDRRGLVVTMSNAVLFDPGKAEVKEQYQEAMKGIAEIITSIDNYVRIEGHTDNIPMNSQLYPSNWELSTARAISVVRLFINMAGASPEQFLAVGYGEYRPIADNSTEEGRAKNRRIDIIILSEESEALERQSI
ncbi:MAG TPA: flagellar motor protein MotB [Bacillota bacterium]|jgi:chemotaxis protein MotB|nr:flagellar motor protein MotB [Bacillota bacterium]